MKSPAYALGYFLVERIGLDRLRELCGSSLALGPTDVSIEQLLEAAGVERPSLASELRAWGATLDPKPYAEARAVRWMTGLTDARYLGLDLTGGELPSTRLRVLPITAPGSKNSTGFP